MDPKEFGAFVQTRRKELGMTQTELAEILNVTSKAVSRWERGIGFPDIQLLESLADALDITLIELMQSRKIEEPIPGEAVASVVSDTVTAIEKQTELSRKQKRDFARGILLIGSSACFLYCLGQFYHFDPPWIGGLLKFIALVGGVLGWRAFQSILTGDYMKEQKDGIWFTWKPWAAFGISASGLAMVTFLKDMIPPDSLWYEVLVIAGFLLMLPGGYYLHLYIFKGE